MKVKTSELKGAALDWAVASIIPYAPAYSLDSENEQVGFYNHCNVFTAFTPSTDWEQGGEIVERELISLEHLGRPYGWNAVIRLHNTANTEFKMWGKTALEAAMRCYVASKLGDTVDVPEELITVA